MIDEFNQQDVSLLISTSTNDLNTTTPSDYKEVMIFVDKAHWGAAICEKIRRIEEEDVFDAVDLKEALKEVPHQRILSTKQIHGINYDEMCAPTPTFSSLQLLFSTAYKTVYLWSPIGMGIPKFKVLKLRKALYGTKQASCFWWMHLKKILQEIGFKSNGEEPSTYTLEHDGEQAILWIHVDDGALTASSIELINQILDQINKRLKMKWDENIKGLVGISINETDEGLKFLQLELIEKVINLVPHNIVAKSPLLNNCQLESNFLCRNMDKPYLKRIGMLLYIAQASWPDIAAYAVNYLARFSLTTNHSHWDAVNHLIAYLRSTRNVGIIISNQNQLSEMNCFVDANWGGEGNKSTHGYLVMHGMNPIAQQFKWQTTIASSTAEAEYMVLSFAAREALWLYHLIYNILKIPVSTLLSDNKTAVGISTDSMNRKQTRHSIRDFNIINEYVATGKLALRWVSTNNQLADIMTKLLGSVKTNQFVSEINR
ncbi:hypothetical protein O181_063780 [Austropuccinia psidii MF-1]|uniref:Reverse transcriptase Ty1/copia-type domain-containing protein n=1 Tax=Austropuccinia psidii MF-1 TaxID=1389203 RepID=A0A9Q3I2H7_9BASI|nr:hypothetical protein [Austropuccinia psidii MF-1]